MKPVFASQSCFDYGTSKAVGKDREHLKIELIEEHSPAIKQGVAFGLASHLPRIKSGNLLMCATPLTKTFLMAIPRCK
jgi:single-stranded-DNA-specific exonuclease